MTSEQIGKAFLECEDHWIWLPGMLVRYEDGKVWYRLTDGDGYGNPFKYVPPNPRRAWPDITDPITAWGTLELVKRAGAYIHKLSVLPMGCNLIIEWPDSIIDSYRGKTLAEITLQALSDAQDRGYKQ